ncbi:MAG: acylneuraminate cytidylyltransferase family protein [Labilithrix sp.]|nr:acylneuraminate cytidylyltransferase family protein [Labilithrix sp.]
MRILAIIPARTGSRGLARKNVRSLAGLPLLVHSLRCAELAPEVTRCIVSTDGREIADIARAHGGDVPFLRPSDLAGDESPMIPVLQHALRAVEDQEHARYEALLLLDPTSPFRLPTEISRAVAMLSADRSAVGVVACSRPSFNPFWVGVVERDGAVESALPSGATYARRQDVEPFFRINGALYLWRTSFLRDAAPSWLSSGRHLLLEMPEERAFSIDDEFQFKVAELLLVQGLIQVPWWSGR